MSRKNADVLSPVSSDNDYQALGDEQAGFMGRLRGKLSPNNASPRTSKGKQTKPRESRSRRSSHSRLDSAEEEEEEEDQVRNGEGEEEEEKLSDLEKQPEESARDRWAREEALAQRDLPQARTRIVSVFASKQRMVLLLSALQVLTWVIGCEALCLLSESCDLWGGRTGSASGLNLLSTLAPGVPQTGTRALLPTAFVMVLVVCPLGIYMAATEVRSSVRLWAGVCTGVSAYLLVMSARFFVQAGRAGDAVSWNINPSAQRFYGTEDAAVRAARNANVNFAIVFLVAGVLSVAKALFFLGFSALLPISITRQTAFTLLPVTALSAADEEEERRHKARTSSTGRKRSKSSRLSRGQSKNKSQSKSKDKGKGVDRDRVTKGHKKRTPTARKTSMAEDSSDGDL